MTATKKQVLAIGIEVGNFHLIQDWINAGLLPTLSSLAKQGALLPMSTVTEISSGSIWPSFSSATNPYSLCSLALAMIDPFAMRFSSRRIFFSGFSIQFDVQAMLYAEARSDRGQKRHGGTWLYWTALALPSMEAFSIWLTQFVTQVLLWPLSQR